MKTTGHSLMAKGILVLLSLLILVFIFTFSWYMDPAAPVSASGLTLSTRNPSTDFWYCVGFSTSQTYSQYKHTAFTNNAEIELDLEHLNVPGDVDEHGDPIDYNLLYDYNAVDVTGDGVHLIRPAMSYGNWSVNYASNNYSTAIENEQYISFDLIFRTKVPNTVIRLDADSFAKGACESYSGDGRLLTDTASYNKDNKYGSFSKDAIVGAVRVAFLEYAEVEGQTGADVLDDEKFNTYVSTPKLLWIPRPDLYLNNQGNDEQIEGWTLNTNVGSSQRFTLVSKAQTTSENGYSTYVHQYYNIFEDRIDTSTDPTTISAPAIVTYDDSDVVKASVLDASAEANTNKVTFGTEADLVELKYMDDQDNSGAIDDEDEWYYGKVRVRIWLEGTDSESRRALAGGKFSVSFQITG